MVRGKKASEKYSVLLIASVLLLYLSSVVSAGTVVIKPGQFDHFTLQMPEKAVAGENFVVKISVYDASKNLITNFSETGKEFRIDVSGSATTQPSVVGASSFSGGLASIIVNDKKAEKIIFSIKEVGGSVPVITREIMVVPNRLDHFVVQSPVSVTAGASFGLKVVAKDIFDNTVEDYDIGKNIKLTTTGTSSVKMQGGEVIDFKNGLASAVFVSEKVGDVVIELQEITSGSKGRTQNIQVNPASLSYFKLQAPKSAVAGESFELLLSAYDMYDNVVTNYTSTGSGVRLSTTGSSKIDPSSVNPSEFRNGQALVKAVYEKAEEIQIVAKELNREQTGKSSDVIVANAAADHFVVITPDSGVSGQKFKIKVEAYDRFNNMVRNFNLIGFDVMLSTSGNGTLSPSKIAPPDFVNGIAVVDAIYDRAESFQISARMATDRSTGRISVSEREVKRESIHHPAKAERQEPVRTPVTEPKVAKKSDGKESQSAKKDKPAVAAKKQSPKSNLRKETVQTGKEVNKAEPKKEVVTKEIPKKASKESEKKHIEPKQSVARKESPVVIPAEKKIEPKAPAVVAEKKIEPKAPAVVAEKKAESKAPVVVAEKKIEQNKPAQMPAKKEDKKTDKLIYNVSKVSIIEAKNKAMLVINVTNPNGNLDYGDEIETKLGKEWLRLRMKPAISTTEKSIKFKSAYVGEVLVEEDKTSGQNLVSIYVELLPSGVTYDIARIKNTLVLTFSNP